MKVLVAGGTGFIGTFLCRELADRGHEVTALTRSPEDARDDVDVVVGDVTVFDSIADPVADHDAVINLVAMSPLRTPPGGNEQHDRIHRGGTANLVRAAEAGDTDRFVQLSALGVDDGPDTAYLRSKAAAERIVRESDLNWVVFRPSVVFGEGCEIVEFPKDLKRLFAPGVPVLPLPGGGKTTSFQPIAVEDLSSMIADAVEDDAHVGNMYEVGGPREYTLREMTALVFEADGRDITIVPLPMGLAKVGMTVMGAVPGIGLGPDQYRSLRLDNTVSENDVDAFGIDPSDLRTFEAFLGVGAESD